MSDSNGKRLDESTKGIGYIVGHSVRAILPSDWRGGLIPRGKHRFGCRLLEVNLLIRLIGWSETYINAIFFLKTSRTALSSNLHHAPGRPCKTAHLSHNHHDKPLSCHWQRSVPTLVTDGGPRLSGILLRIAV